ncbi:MAG: methyl-accepting chemotaxis protein [Anaerolineae bacterium]|nr:methyl-accepting chemotaxis protein [Anaerolineae bacterium]
MIEQFHNTTNNQLNAYPYPLRGGIVGIGAGLLFLIAYFANPAPLKLLLALAYALVGIGALLMSVMHLGGSWKQAIPLLLSVITSFGLLFFTIYEPWWMALVGVALLLTALAAQVSTERALLLATGHGVAVAIAAVIRWGTLDPLTTEHVILGVGLLVLGQPAVIFLLPSPSTKSIINPNINLESETDYRELSMQLRMTTDGLVRATDAINQVTTQQSAGAVEQSEAITATNNLLDTFYEMSQQVQEQVRSITLMAGQTAEFSQKGQDTIQETVSEMQHIRTQVTAIAQTIVKLSQFIQRIDEIIMSVSEIATQSNLLALNASIEAAHAGVHGRGFAIVADEVRSLSQQSTAAAHQVRGILGQIQDAMRETVESTQVGMQGTDSGLEMTEQVSEVMITLSNSVRDSYQSVKSIYDMIRQQMDDLEQITIGLERIERINQQNSASTRMVETVSANLTRLASELQILMAPSAVDQYAEDNRENDPRYADQNP